MVKFANLTVPDKTSAEKLAYLRDRMAVLFGILGITEAADEALDAELQALVDERQAARKARNYARADEIRAELAARGILLEDTKEGVKWKRA